MTKMKMLTKKHWCLVRVLKTTILNAEHKRQSRVFEMTVLQRILSNKKRQMPYVGIRKISSIDIELIQKRRFLCFDNNIIKTTRVYTF